MFQVYGPWGLCHSPSALWFQRKSCGSGCVAIKLYLQNQAGGRSLLTPALECAWQRVGRSTRCLAQREFLGSMPRALLASGELKQPPEGTQKLPKGQQEGDATEAGQPSYVGSSWGLPCGHCSPWSLFAERKGCLSPAPPPQGTCRRGHHTSPGVGPLGDTSSGRELALHTKGSAEVDMAEEGASGDDVLFLDLGAGYAGGGDSS